MDALTSKINSLLQMLKDPGISRSLFVDLLNDNKEKLASLEHEQWINWTRYMLDNLTPENIERWKKQIETPYEELSEKEKDSDRKWVDKIIECFSEIRA